MKTKTLNLGLIFIALAALVFASVHSTMAQGGAWTTNASSPTPRRQVAVAAANGILYTAGGAQARSTSSIDTFEAYDPVADTWTSKASLPVATQGAAAGAIGGI